MDHLRTFDRIFYIIGRSFHWNSETRIATTLCCGLGNTSFLGLPILKVFYGEKITNSVLIIDQFGTFLCLAIPGFILSLNFFIQKRSGKKRKPGRIHSEKALYFSSFSCFTFSFLLRFFTISESIHSVFKILGETLVPIALFTVGFQMEFPTLESKSEKSENFIQPLFVGLVYKLLLSPIVIFITYRFLDVSHLRVAVLEAAMAPMITASIVSIQMGFRPALSALFPGVGILVSIPTLFLFYMILENFF